MQRWVPFQRKATDMRSIARISLHRVHDHLGTVFTMRPEMVFTMARNMHNQQTQGLLAEITRSASAESHLTKRHDGRYGLHPHLPT